MAGPGSGAAGGALPATASASASSSAGIPSNARKVVQQLKEVVQGTDDEIYAMLRDCNMDPDETVQRLLNQDPFHEVKRRQKKKESGGNKDGSESRQRPNGPSSRGGRSGPSERGAGRGGGGPRYSNDYNGGGRGKQFVPRENGIHSSNRGSSGVASTTASSGSSFSQSKGFPSGASNSGSAPAPIPPSAVAAGPASTPSPAAVPAPAPASVSAPSLSNGSSVYARTALVGQSWVATSGHATMADIVKSNGAPPPPPSLPAALQPSVPSAAPQQYVTSPPAGSVSSGVYSSSTDPVLHPSLDPRAGTPGTIKRELGSVGNQRPIGDRPSVSVIVDGTSISSPPHQSHILSLSATTSGSAPLESEVQVSGPSSPAGTADVAERVGNQSVLSDVGNGGVVSRQSSGAVQSNVSATTVPRTVLGGGQFNGRAGYQAQQPVGTQKSSGSGQEWKPKPAISNSLGIGSSIGTSNSSVTSPEPSRAPSAPAPAQDASVTASATAKLQGLSIQDDQQVIIPNHLQVPEADQVTGLSFGSFAAGYGTSYSSNFVPEEPIKNSLPISEAASLVEPPVEQPSTSVSSSSPVSLNQNFVHQPVASPPESMVPSNEVTASTPVPAVQQLELSKPDPVVQQHYQYHGLPAVASYPGFGLMPQIASPQYSYEPDPAPDVSRLPSIMQAYADPTSSYYTPAFRPGTDPDRYPPFLTSNATSKFNGNMGLQSPQTSQETGNSLPSTGASVQTSQTGNAQPAPTIPQQAVPVHAYAAQAGVPVGHFASVFGYQFMPSSYAYMPHPPYQHSYSGNSGYPQLPAGTSYPQAGGSSYPPAGAGGVKYGLPQYKPGSASGNVPHSGAGSAYGGYTPTPAGYASNPTVTAGTASGYEDVPQPYKDNLYIPPQPAEGGVWIQAPLSRDMGGAGLQTSSYYNMPNQGQHAGYSHTQQPAHAHAHPGAGYASLYHPTQSGPAPSGHQLLQQPQALGATGSGGQAGAYQQPQRTQQTWNTNY